MGAFSIHSGARGPAAGAEWQRVPKWGLEYPSPSFGYKGDQREGIGRNEEGRVGVGEGREAPIQEGRTREWVGVPSLTDRPLQTHPRSAKQEHHPPWSPLFSPEMLALPETCIQCPRPRRPSEYGWRQLGWGAGWSQESTVTQSQAPSGDTRGCDPADGRAQGGRRSHLPLKGEANDHQGQCQGHSHQCIPGVGEDQAIAVLQLSP